MKWLSRIGQIINKTLQVVGVFGPVVSASIPGDRDDRIVNVISRDLAEAANVIVNAEAVGQALGLAGPQKLIAAAPGVAQVILGSALLAGRKVANPDLFKAGSTKVADGLADILNSLKDDIDTVDKEA